jgi:predicted PurR-regulated permease PerM
MVDTKKQTINISSGIIFRVVFVVLFLIFLYLIRDVIVIFLFALIIASAVTPAVNVLNKIKIPRVIGALLVYILFFGILALLIYLVIPSVTRDLSTLTSSFPDYLEKLTTKFESLKDHFSRYQAFFNQFTNYLNNIKQTIQNSAPMLFSGALNVFGGFSSFILVLVISFYLSVQKSGIQRTLTAIIPLQYRDYLLNLWERAQKKLGRWLQGQLFLGLIVGSLVYIGLYFLDVKFALLLAILAGILEIFPYIGPVLAGIPAVIVGFLQAPILAVWILILYIAIQQIENHLIVPIVVGKVVGLNPVTIILALLIGGKLGGLLGIILSVPLAAVFAEFLRDLIRKRKQEQPE